MHARMVIFGRLYPRRLVLTQVSVNCVSSRLGRNHPPQINHGSADHTSKFRSFDCGDHYAGSPRACTDVEKKEIDEVVRSISQERDEQRTIQQIVNMTVLQIQEQIV